MAITILIFIVILGILVFVHEFGHFVVARKSGMKVDEFGFGFPPRAFGIQVLKENKIISSSKTETITESETDIKTAEGEVVLEKIVDVVKESQEVIPRKKWHFIWSHKPPLDPDETVYSINWIPFGGFVKIRGENNENEEDPRSFINRPFGGRLATLVAGVAMNFILAWVLISVGFVVGLPAAVGSPSEFSKYAKLKDPQVAIMEVVPNFPAAKAGILAGDILKSVDGKVFSQIEQAQSYIQQNAGKEFVFVVNRAGQDLEIKIPSIAKPKQGEGPTGIALSNIGKITVPWYIAPWEGAKTTVLQVYNIGYGIYQLVTAKLGWSAVGGPIKIAQLTGQVSRMGFDYLLQFTAFLSLNFAILNILPFPAFDGGRVLFLIIEKIRGKKNNQKVEQYVNTAGFVFLILLMILVTIKDIRGV